MVALTASNRVCAPKTGRSSTLAVRQPVRDPDIIMATRTNRAQLEAQLFPVTAQRATFVRSTFTGLIGGHLMACVEQTWCGV